MADLKRSHTHYTQTTFILLVHWVVITSFGYQTLTSSFSSNISLKQTSTLTLKVRDLGKEDNDLSQFSVGHELIIIHPQYKSFSQGLSNIQETWFNEFEHRFSQSDIDQMVSR